LRIISGSLKGRLIQGPPKGECSIRPSSDRLREALFNHLIHRGLDFSESHGFDLYAGTGALGLEAYSRGASKILWVDASSLAQTIIRKNLSSLAIASGDSFQIYSKKVLTLLQEGITWEPFRSFLPLRWIFLDPPYDAPETFGVLAEIDRLVCEKKLLEPGGWVVLEASTQDARKFGQWSPVGLEYFSEHTYGSAKLYCWRRPL